MSGNSDGPKSGALMGGDGIVSSTSASMGFTVIGDGGAGFGGAGFGGTAFGGVGFGGVGFGLGGIAAGGRVNFPGLDAG